MYNADMVSENELLDILNPILKSESVWKSHALLLMADYSEINKMELSNLWNLSWSSDFSFSIKCKNKKNEVRPQRSKPSGKKFNQ